MDHRAQQAYYINMRQLPQALTHTNYLLGTDSVSLQVTMATSNQTKYGEQLDEQEMINMMVEDDNETGSTSTDSGLDDDGMPLAMDHTPSTPSPTHAPTPNEQHGNDSEVSIWGSEGNALDQETILQDLISDTVTPVDVTGNFSSKLSGAILDYQELSISTSISNVQATAMQDMLQTQCAW